LQKNLRCAWQDGGEERRKGGEGGSDLHKRFAKPTGKNFEKES